MAKETTKKNTISACEIYVLEELKQAKKELEEIKVAFSDLERKHISLLKLIERATKGFEIKSDENKEYDFVYFNNSYMFVLDKDLTKEDKKVQALISLIKLGE